MNASHRRVLLLPLAIAAALALGACSSSGSGAPGGGTTGSVTGPDPNTVESAPPGDIPDNQAFVSFTPTGQGYTMGVPEGWARTSAGAATLFTDKFNSIRVEKHAAAKAPTIASARATELPAIKAASRGFVPGTVTTVQRKSGSAVKITYQADSDPDGVTGKVILQDVERYEFWRQGSEVVITLSASQGSDNVDPWRIVTDSFAWTP